MANVLAVTPAYLPHSRVGAWIATHRFLCHMAGRGHEVAVLSRRHRREAYAIDGIVVEAGSPGRLSTRPRWADVIISHAGDGGAGLAIAQQHGKRSVRMVHGHGYNQIGNPDLAVFNSRGLQTAAGWAGNSIVCHPPTFPDDHRVDQTGDAITIINCSQDKGIKTAWRVAEQMPDRRFLGVKGGYGHQVEPRALNFTTIPTVADMRTVWTQTRILLVPSSFETWAMVGIEAMCSGIPVIAHPTPGLQESLADAGIFVDRDDIDGWVAAIERLDDPDEYRQLSERALGRVAQLDPQGSLDRFATEVEALCAS